MKKINLIILIMIGIFSYAQNSESTYLQQEHDRLGRINTHEANIQNYINQNISSYVLPTATTNKITTQKHEDGSNYSASELNEIILNTKKQNLREAYFSQSPTAQNDYQATSLTLATSCTNNGFENGDVSGFSFYSQKFPEWSIFNNFPSIPNSPQSNGIISVVDNSQKDGIVTSLDRVKNGNYAIKLNNGNGGDYDVSSMSREILIGSNQDNVTFNYALVLQDPGHLNNGVNTNPYYQCRLKTQSNNIVFERKIVADKNNTDVFMSMIYQGQDLVYTGWNCESIDVTQYKGQTLILEVIVADCGQSAHFGYAYFDNFCGVKCSAPTFGKVVLDPMGITCPLMPLTVTGSYIAPTGYELQNLTLRAKNIATGAYEYTTSPGQYVLSGNEFRFTLSGSSLFPGGASNKQFDFFVTATFKLIGGTSTMDVESQSANDGPDAIFTTSCKICNACAPPLTTYYFRGTFEAWTNRFGTVTYINEFGTEETAVIGYYEDGCQGIQAVSIVRTRFVSNCNDQK